MKRSQPVYETEELEHALQVRGHLTPDELDAFAFIAQRMGEGVRDYTQQAESASGTHSRSNSVGWEVEIERRTVARQVAADQGKNPTDTGEGKGTQKEERWTKRRLHAAQRQAQAGDGGSHAVL